MSIFKATYPLSFVGFIKIQFLHASNSLRSCAFLHNVSKLVSGEVIAQAVAFASIPLLTRLYGPSAFGILGVFMALSEIGGKVSTLRYDVALVLPKEDRLAWAIYRFATLWCIVFSLLLLLCAYPFRLRLSLAFGTEALAPYFPMIALMILGIGLQSLASFWSLRGKYFGVLAKSSAGSSVIGNGCKIGAGLLGFGVGGLLFGTALQRWSNLFLIRVLTPGSIWLQQAKLGDLKRQALAYSEFPRYRMPQDALNSFSRQIPNILLASFFSPVVAGFYILATRIIRLPFSLLQEAVRKVFYMEAVESEQRGESLFRLCARMTILIAVGMLPVVCVVFIWGTVLAEAFFGHEWATTGIYAKWVILAVSCSFCSVPASVVIPILAWNRFYLIFEAVSMILRILIIIVVAMTLTADAMVATIALSTCASSFVLIGIVFNRLRAQDSKSHAVIS